MFQPQAAPSAARFLALVDRYAGYVSRAGRPVRRSTTDDAQRAFLHLEEDRRASLITRLEREIGIFDEILAAGENLNDSSRILWRLFAKNGHTPRGDIFGRISDTDVVEVYGTDHRHIFQNFNFYNYISHTLETIFCATWYQATKRDQEIELKLQEAMRRVFEGRVRETHDPEVPTHVFEELDTERLFKVQIKIKCLSPVYSDGQLAGLVTVNDCKLVGSRESCLRP